jgi:hypothetical protein
MKKATCLTSALLLCLLLAFNLAKKHRRNQGLDYTLNVNVNLVTPMSQCLTIKTVC